jgi:hypothetical protein
MSHKTPAIKIIAALGIPLFPLGAHYFQPPNKAPVFREAGPAPQGVQETPAFEPEGFAGPGEGGGETLPPIRAETLARVFSPPNRGAAREKPPGGGAISQAQPVPGDGKFSYLGSIRESDDQEWLYIKEKETGRIISINAKTASIDEERCVVEIEGTSYFIRRN